MVNCGVKKRIALGLNFVIDKLTNSIENRITGETFATKITHLTREDLKTVTKRNGWVFDWKFELNQAEREVYKITTSENLYVIQGLISLEIKFDHVYMHLVESAPFNKGRDKVYEGVPGNLVAFACRVSFERGFHGNLSFISKTQLIRHYVETLGAFHAGGRLMIIETRAALKLLDKYFKNTEL